MIRLQVALCPFVIASVFSASAQPSPTPRTAHSAAWDAAHGELVVFGGFDGLSPTDETWVWNGTWTLKNPATRPTARVYANMVFDEARQQVVLFGGSEDTVAGLSDTWVWDGNEWSNRFTTNRPPARFMHGMAYDAVRQETVVFGGYDSGSALNDTWAWNGTNWFNRNPVSSPSPRAIRQGMAYDKQRQEVILFGGDSGGSATNDTWAWKGTNWNILNPATAPVSRIGHALAYDEARSQITLFGGSALNDTWVWEGTNWLQQTPQQMPPARNGHTLTYAPTDGSLLLFGGSDGLFGVTFGDRWLWNGTNWQQSFVSFRDSFEAPTLNPLWSVTAQSGAVDLSTNRALSGIRSIQVSSTQDTGRKTITVSHLFPQALYGRVSVWVYDAGADELAGNELGLRIENQALGLTARFFAPDYDLGPMEGGTYRYQAFGDTATTRTAIDRTKAWHRYTVTSTEFSLVFQIDGRVIYSGPGGVRFDAVRLEMSGPTWRPAVVANFDDFEVTELSAPSTPSADLSITTTVSPTPPITGTNFSYTIVVTNLGPDAATNVTMIDVLPTDVALTSVGPVQGSCTNYGGIVTCDFGFLTNGASATVTITVTPLAEGTLPNVARVFSATTDLNYTNNAVTTETIVLLPAESASFRFVNIPDLPAEVSLGRVWARTENEAYVWGSRIAPGTFDLPESFLFRWNGSEWVQILGFSGHRLGGVFGVGASEVFISLRDMVQNRSRVLRSTDGGQSFVDQALPAEAITNEVREFAGTTDNVHAIVDGGRIIRFDGAAWNLIYEDGIENVRAHTMLNPNEGYYVTCWGWGSWDGSSWRFFGRQFDFCDVSGTWAIHDPTGPLHWYAVGNNQFANGVRVWKFDEATQSFGGRTNTVLGEGNGIDIGSATGIWGSASDDVYVIGELATAPGGGRAGRIYHFDGGAWSRLTQFGEIAPPGGVYGTSSNDVWVSLTDGRMLRLRKSGLTNDPPQITTHPVSATGTVGSTVSFGITARGTPPLDYRWQLNFTNIVGATNPVLTLTGLTPADAGLYRAVVTNLFGSATSTVATLTVVALPVITSQPQGTNVTIGANVSLSVTASGVGLQYQWRKNGANIDGATNSTLVLSNITVTDGGSYTVVVANNAGAVTSDIAELRILVPGSPPSRDNFVDREPISLTNGVLTVFSGTSSNATKEPNEPDHAGRVGGRSVWYTWQAPASGTVELSTHGSTFDTLLAVYTGTSLTNLVEVASNDDEESNDPGASTNRFFASAVRFNAVAGTAYQIALDGFNGAGGSYLLSGLFIQTPDLLPEITVQPANQVVSFGGVATFSVRATGANLVYAWYFNGDPIPGAVSDTLIVSNAGAGQVGSYSVRVTDSGSGRSVDSRRTVLEISSQPTAGVVFQDKLEFGTSGAAPARLARSKRGPIQKAGPEDAPFYSVSAGSIGYHLGNNVFGTTDLHETNHCNLVGRGSLYLRFETKAAGTLLIHSSGSVIDNLIAVYRDVSSYDDLPTNLLGCATNNIHDVVPSSAGIPNAVEIPGVTAGQRFMVVSDGIKGESGVLRINWLIGDPARPGSIPPPPIVRVNEGEATTLPAVDDVNTNAVPPPAYQWYRDGLVIPSATSPGLDLPDPTARDAGLYYAVITTPFGIITNYVATVEVRIPFSLVGLADRLSDGIFDVQVSGTPGEPFILQSTPDFFGWTDLVVGTLPGYTVTLSDTNAGFNPVRFYRIFSNMPVP